MLGAGALGRPRGMVWGGRREEGSGWGTHVYLWWKKKFKKQKQTNKQKKHKIFFLHQISLNGNFPMCNNRNVYHSSIIILHCIINYQFSHPLPSMMFYLSIFLFLWVCSVTKSCPTLQTPWIVVHQVPLSMAFPRQEYSSGLLFICPGDLHNPVEPASLVSPALQADSLSLSHLGSLYFY